MVDVYSADADKHCEKHERIGKLPREPEADIRQQVKHRAARLEYHVPGRHLSAAVAAFPAQEDPAEYREHIVPREPVTAGKAVGRLGYNGLLQRGAEYHDVEEAADNRPENENKRPKDDLHDVNHIIDPLKYIIIVF